jgi:two-component system phosphate regulon response regulator PhoB
VVDDEAHILHVLSLKLRNAGFAVITAGDGEEAFDIALREKPDLLITDFQMSFVTGLELCEKLKREPTTARIPAIMLTARGFSMNEDDVQRTNIEGVLTKPFSPRQILARVQELLNPEAATNP